MSDTPEQDKQPAQPSAKPSGKQPGTVEVIPPSLANVLRDLGANPEDPKIRQVLEVSGIFYRGSMPLPPPSVLADLEKVCPGVTQKIIGWTEEQSAHRKNLERQRVEGDETRKFRGQFIAASIAIFGLTLSAVEGIWGNAWVASVIAIVSIGGPVTALVLALGMGWGGKKPEPPKASLPTPTPTTPPNASANSP